MQSASPTGADGNRRTTASLEQVVKTFLVGKRFTAKWRTAFWRSVPRLAYRRRRAHRAIGEGHR